jgi:hypothetical protein
LLERLYVPEHDVVHATVDRTSTPQIASGNMLRGTKTTGKVVRATWMEILNVRADKLATRWTRYRRGTIDNREYHPAEGARKRTKPTTFFVTVVLTG